MINGLEAVAIGTVVIVLLVFGGKKIPELARALGQSRKAFKDGQKEE